MIRNPVIAKKIMTPIEPSMKNRDHVGFTNPKCLKECDRTTINAPTRRRISNELSFSQEHDIDESAADIDPLINFYHKRSDLIQGLPLRYLDYTTTDFHVFSILINDNARTVQVISVDQGRMQLIISAVCCYDHRVIGQAIKVE